MFQREIEHKIRYRVSRCALDNRKQYAMMRHILFKLEYLFSKSSTMQGWEMETATRIFFCSGRSLSKRVKTLGGQCFSSHFRNSGPFHHLSALIKSRDLALATTYQQGCRRMLHDVVWFLSDAEFHSPYLLQKLITAVRGRLSSLAQSSSPTKDKSVIARVPMIL